MNDNREPAVDLTPALVEDARALVDAAHGEGILLRLIGGLAFRVQAPGWPGRPSRARVDIDFVTTSSHRMRASALLAQFGCTPDVRHNALFGRRQMYFFDEARGRAVDLIVDRLEMCHQIDLRDRLDLDPVTVPLADLLLSKLQIVNLNEKDALDVLALLTSHPLGPTDAEISIPRILAHTSKDWGWWRTVSGNLDWIESFASDDSGRGEIWSTGLDPLMQLRALRQTIDQAPKSVRWTLRSQVGDRLPWYDMPEEVGHGV